ncbi:MAG: hypothetical protein R3223_10550, partial [Longimicrobiales bacterium]|nr:hypothetical protein [Longimicrobiales bacterium]
MRNLLSGSVRQAAVVVTMAVIATVMGPGIGSGDPAAGEGPGTADAPAISGGLTAQERPAADTLPTGGRQRLPALEFRPLDFDPPRVEERTVAGGIPVLFLEDRSL